MEISFFFKVAQVPKIFLLYESNGLAMKHNANPKYVNCLFRIILAKIALKVNEYPNGTLPIIFHLVWWNFSLKFMAAFIAIIEGECLL